MSIIKKKATKTVTGYNIGPNQAFVDPQEVFKLAALGCTDKEIADWFEITTKLLNDNFKSELSKGRAGLRHKLRQYQMDLAPKNATMLIWLGKQYLGQSENPQNTEANQPLPWNSNDQIDQMTRDLDERGFE